MKIATVAYFMDFLTSRGALCGGKIAADVSEAAQMKPELTVFPEYGAMVRALENQCVTGMCSLVGNVATGAGGIFGPPDAGFRATGIIGLGEVGVPGRTDPDVDLKRIAKVRRDGRVLGRQHRPAQKGRANPVPIECLR